MSLTTDSHNRNVSAFFDTQGSAQQAVDDLVAAGIPRQHISITAGQGAGSVVGEHPVATEDKGFWDSLKDLFLPEEDRHTYAEGLRRGGHLVSVRTDDANYDRVLDILDRDGSVNMEERESEWRSEGWSGYGSGAQGLRTAETSTGLFAGAEHESAVVAGTPIATPVAPVGLAASNGTASTTPASVATRTGSATATTLGTGTDEVIPVYEESLRVGKRDVNHGRVRVRSYVVETPVSEQVSLHDENVSIERRPVDRAIGAGDALFQDRIIEAEEHTEEAVIAKEARVKEEITLRRTAEDRTQTVSDTVRHTEVEVDDQRRAGLEGGVTRFVAATDSARIMAHMDVIASEGTKIGTVDHLDGPDMIKLAKTTSPDGEHHHVPLAWVEHVDAHVHLNKTAAEAKASW